MNISGFGPFPLVNQHKNDFKIKENESEKINIPVDYNPESIFDSLYKIGLIDEHGLICANQSNIDHLPPLDTEGELRLSTIRESILTWKINNYTIEITFDFISNIIQEFVERDKNKYSIHHIELNGGIVPYILGANYFKNFLNQWNIISSEDEKFLNEITKMPPDIDQRIFCDGLSDMDFEEIRLLIIDKISSLLINKYDHLSKKDAIKLILKNGFSKLQRWFDGLNDYLIVSFKVENGFSIDYLIIKKIARRQLFFRDDLVIPINNKKEIIPTGSIQKGRQALVCRLTKIISVPEIETVNYYGWLLLISYLTRDHTYTEASTEKKLRKSLRSHLKLTFSEIDTFSNLIKKTLYNHHCGELKISALFYLLNTIYHLQNDYSEELLKKLCRDVLIFEGNNENNLLIALEELLKNPKIPFKFIFAVINIAAKISLEVSSENNHFEKRHIVSKPGFQFKFQKNDHSFSFIFKDEFDKSMNYLIKYKNEFKKCEDLKVFFKTLLSDINYQINFSNKNMSLNIELEKLPIILEACLPIGLHLILYKLIGKKESKFLLFLYDQIEYLFKYKDEESHFFSQFCHLLNDKKILSKTDVYNLNEIKQKFLSVYIEKSKHTLLKEIYLRLKNDEEGDVAKWNSILSSIITQDNCSNIYAIRILNLLIEKEIINLQEIFQRYSFVFNNILSIDPNEKITFELFQFYSSSLENFLEDEIYASHLFEGLNHFINYQKEIEACKLINLIKNRSIFQKIFQFLKEKNLSIVSFIKEKINENILSLNNEELKTIHVYLNNIVKNDEVLSLKKFFSKKAIKQNFELTIFIDSDNLNSIKSLDKKYSEIVILKENKEVTEIEFNEFLKIYINRKIELQTSEKKNIDFLIKIYQDYNKNFLIIFPHISKVIISLLLNQESDFYLNQLQNFEFFLNFFSLYKTDHFESVEFINFAEYSLKISRECHLKSKIQDKIFRNLFKLLENYFSYFLENKMALLFFNLTYEMYLRKVPFESETIGLLLNNSDHLFQLEDNIELIKKLRLILTWSFSSKQISHENSFLNFFIKIISVLIEKNDVQLIKPWFVTLQQMLKKEVININDQFIEKLSYWIEIFYSKQWNEQAIYLFEIIPFINETDKNFLYLLKMANEILDNSTGYQCLKNCQPFLQIKKFINDRVFIEKLENKILPLFMKSAIKKHFLEIEAIMSKSLLFKQETWKIYLKVINENFYDGKYKFAAWNNYLNYERKFSKNNKIYDKKLRGECWREGIKLLKYSPISIKLTYLFDFEKLILILPISDECTWVYDFFEFIFEENAVYAAANNLTEVIKKLLTIFDVHFKLLDVFYNYKSSLAFEIACIASCSPNSEIKNMGMELFLNEMNKKIENNKIRKEDVKSINKYMYILSKKEDLRLEEKINFLNLFCFLMTKFNLNIDILLLLQIFKKDNEKILNIKNNIVKNFGDLIIKKLFKQCSMVDEYSIQLIEFVADFLIKNKQYNHLKEILDNEFIRKNYFKNIEFLYFEYFKLVLNHCLEEKFDLIKSILWVEELYKSLKIYELSNDVKDSILNILLLFVFTKCEKDKCFDELIWSVKKIISIYSEINISIESDFYTFCSEILQKSFEIGNIDKNEKVFINNENKDELLKYKSVINILHLFDHISYSMMINTFIDKELNYIFLSCVDMLVNLMVKINISHANIFFILKLYIYSPKALNDSTIYSIHLLRLESLILSESEIIKSHFELDLRLVLFFIKDIKLLNPSFHAAAREYLLENINHILNCDALEAYLYALSIFLDLKSLLGQEKKEILYRISKKILNIDLKKDDETIFSNPKSLFNQFLQRNDFLKVDVEKYMKIKNDESTHIRKIFLFNKLIRKCCKYKVHSKILILKLVETNIDFIALKKFDMLEYEVIKFDALMNSMQFLKALINHDKNLDATIGNKIFSILLQLSECLGKVYQKNKDKILLNELHTLFNEYKKIKGEKIYALLMKNLNKKMIACLE